MTPCGTAALEFEGPFDLIASQRLLRLGPSDPSVRLEGDAVWRTTRSPDGPVTYRAHSPSDRTVQFDAWGPGAPWALDNARSLLGLTDDPTAFTPDDPLLRRLHARYEGLRLPRTLRITERLIVTILQQLVTWREARRAYHLIIDRYGEDAPGPVPLRLLPSSETLRRVPGYALTPLGVLYRQSRTLAEVAARGRSIDRLIDRPPLEAQERLSSIRGLGPWTLAWMRAVVFGDADAVLLGDYHLPNEVCFALTGDRNGNDARMLELLEPYAGHRWRAITLLRLGSKGPPRRGPRRAMRPLPR